jgi:hypothetical protein
LALILRLPFAAPGIRQPTFQEMRSADHRQIRERLRKIAQRFTDDAQFLGEEAEVIGESQCFFHSVLRLLQAAGASEAFHVPKRTGRERPLARCLSSAKTQRAPTGVQKYTESYGGSGPASWIILVCSAWFPRSGAEPYRRAELSAALLQAVT